MLSIIIPALNEEEYLPLLLENIKKQNFSDYEIIVADAGSVDKTVEIAKNYGCKIVQGGLPARGRNEGAKAARGEILLFMDADNIYLPEKFLETLIWEFKKRNLGVATFPIYPDGKKIDRIIYGFYNKLIQATQFAFAFNSVLVKKEIFEKVGGFDEEIKLAEDHYFVRQSIRYGKFGFIKTEPVLTSARRFNKEGRLKIYFKFFLAAIWFLLFGPIKSDIFRYRFDRLDNQ